MAMAEAPTHMNTTEATAIQTETGLRYSWRDLDRASAMMANLFADWAVPAQARILVQVEPSVEALVLHLACWRGGYGLVALQSQHPAADMAAVLAAVQPAVLVCSSAHMGSLSKLAFQAATRHVVTLNADRTGSLLDRASHHADQQVPVPTAAPSDLGPMLAAISAGSTREWLSASALGAFRCPATGA